MTLISDPTVTYDEERPDRAATVLVVVEGRGALHLLPERGEVVLGRDSGCDLPIEHGSVSRRHAVLRIGDGITIRDLGSANGVKLSGQTLARGEEAPLPAGAIAQLGAVWLLVHDAREPAAPAPPAGPFEGVVVRDPAMVALYQLVARVAPSELPVLILGETGAGKELVAAEIHRRSRRHAGPFLRLNCASLPRSLIEGELFGHEKGSFTGATGSKAGLLETADGGTILLDEIGELALDLQVALLRVLEERKVWRIGGREARDIDVRFIAATNRDLRAEVEAGGFRKDLFFRLNGITLSLPPLRERPLELGALCSQFAGEAAARHGTPASGRFSDEALALLRAHRWPGNIRELRHVVERAVVLAAGATIEADHLPAELREAAGAAAGIGAAGEQGLRGELIDLERKRILDALQACKGNQTRAAAALGMPRRTLVKRLAAYGVKRPRKKVDR